MKDEFPIFSKEKLNKFYNHSYDSVLGWDRKNNTSGKEYSNKITKFNIGTKGFRISKKRKKTFASVYGDSFAFCRYVNDNKTWESYFENKIKKNLLNYGVGNYGLDQSFLKFLKKKDKNKIIIFNVVPETIARINSYWKHYREFGNILAFKPIIKISKKDHMKITKIKIKKNYSEKQIHNTFSQIKKIDIFYKSKFSRNIFKFPYLFNFLSNPKKNIYIFFFLTLDEIFKNNYFFKKAQKIILEENIMESHLMYDDEFFNSKLKNLIYFMNSKISKSRKKMILIITPQLIDLKFKTLKYSTNFYKNLDKDITCLDLTEDLVKIKNYQKLYLQDVYGGHLNERGNKTISNLIYKKLKNKKILWLNFFLKRLIRFFIKNT